MVLSYLGVSLDGQAPNPPTFVSWLNKQTTNGRSLNLINHQSCGLAWNSAAMASRLHIKRITKMRVPIWPNTWAQTQGRGGLFNEIAGELRLGIPVIAEVAPGAPTHFVVITGWKTWAFSGTSGASSREFGSQVKVAAKRHGRGMHYDGTMGDFIINDPAVGAPGSLLFAKYTAIERLYRVRRT
jgi:hypothetical protein